MTKKMKVYFETYGCSLNFSDTDIMKGFFDDSELTNLENAEVVVINTCTVKGPTERKMLKRIKELSKTKKVVVAGCLAEAQPELVKQYNLVGTENLDKIRIAVKNAIEGKVEHFIGENNNIIKKFFNKHLHSKIIEIIPISRGCLSQCSYCITKLARKDLKSYPIDVIINRIKYALEKGVKEIWLTSEDLGCYGFDINTNIVELMKKINELFEKEKKFAWIRLGMSNPNYIKRFIKDILYLIDNGPYFKFLHLPVQSGSNKILTHMKRMYTVEDLIDLINIIRNHDNYFTISTDIIVGYPTETEDDFKETLKLLEIIKPDVVNISRFWPRPKTEAFKLKQLHGRVIKERSRKVTKLCNQIELERNKMWLNKNTMALIDEINEKRSESEMVFVTSRNEYYKPIILHENIEIGKFISVEIIDAKAHYLVGKIKSQEKQIKSSFQIF